MVFGMTFFSGTAMQLQSSDSEANIEQVRSDQGVANAGGSECNGHLNPLSVGGRATMPNLRSVD